MASMASRGGLRHFGGSELLLMVLALSFSGAAGAGHSEAMCHHEHEEIDFKAHFSGGEGSRALASGRHLLQACNCNGNGDCVTDALTLLTACSCYTGFTGADCTLVVGCSDLADCGGHGICVKGGICACDPGWSGDNCTIGHCPQDCSGNGVCNTTSGVCACDPGWGGRACSLPQCTSNCSNHGVCVDGACECEPGYAGLECEDFVCVNECSGNGICLPTGCECSPWFTGEDCGTQLCPRNCSQHGSCVDGKCVCDSGWSGYDCSNHLCPNGCSGRGNCLPGGVCVCQTGWAGAACDLSAVCPSVDCSGHGTCRITPGQNATCFCDPDWGGEDCSVSGLPEPPPCLNNCSFHGSCDNGECLCDAGWSGVDCSFPPCPNGCSQHGSCVNGTCACDPGWTEADCSAMDVTIVCAQNCSSGSGVYQNGTCLCDVVVEPVPCPGNCTGRGACFNGTCACDAGYTGPACDAVVDVGGGAPACANNCSMRGSCVNGTCLCDVGWGGGDCSVAAQAPAGPGCLNNCSAHGACDSNNTCVCDPGWLGPDCSMDVVSAPACAFNCSGRGACVNSTCWCEAGYSGTHCEVYEVLGSTPIPAYNWTADEGDGGCPSGCSGHGTCVDGGCECDPFYSGAACDVAVNRLILDCPQDCSQHGTCMNGTCMCDPMWDGIDCSYPSLCPGYSEAHNSNCSGHGSCMNGTCLCDPNWLGMECSVAACPGKCSGNGICANGTCACDLGWAGEDCSELGCPGNCGDHGTCVVDIFTGDPMCVCDEGWMGTACDVRVCPTSPETRDPYIPCSGHGACTQGGECICYEKYVGLDCSILIDCGGRGFRQCGFCACENGFDGEECDVDACAESRVYDPEFPDDPSMSTVCNGQGECSAVAGCVCEQGWSGANCTDPATCVDPAGATRIDCNGRGTCSGGRDDPGTCKCAEYAVANTPHRTPRWLGRYCSVEQCPGYRGIDSQGAPIVCSGKGTCGAGLVCSCFAVQGQLYTGADCGVPPVFLVSEIRPKVGPLEGGTIVSIFGPGIERYISLRAAPNVIFCNFSTGGLVPAQVGDTPDSIVCVSPPVSQAYTAPLLLTDSAGVPWADIDNSATFEYYAMTRIIRITPSFGPLRPQAPLRGPSATNLPNTVTVTGTYFPPDGEFSCRFGDCNSPSGTALWVDASTVVCTMPELAEAGVYQLSVSSNRQQYSNTVGRPSAYTVYAITEIAPKCAANVGIATLTVYGDYLVDPADSTRVLSNQWCRFGRVTTSGGTRSSLTYATTGFKLFAFHSQAVPSTRAPGALECMVPDWPTEVPDFSLSLDATYVQTDANLPDGYYRGQWDETDDIQMNSYYPPFIGLRPGPGNQVLPHPYLVEPTIGPSAGGTRVTIAGIGFHYALYGPNTGNDVFAAWSPLRSVPNCNPFPIPRCRFGTALTRRVEILNNETLVCISPLLPDEIVRTQTVLVSVALDGQTYSTEAIQFQYHPAHSVSAVTPVNGVRSGGTTVTVDGRGFVSSFLDSNGGSPFVLTCVFISTTDTNIRLKSTSTRFLGPERLTCVTPEVVAAGDYIVDVSMSGQLEDSQLSGSGVIYTFYQDPIITAIADDVGSIFGGETVFLRGDFLINLPTIQCRFGVPGRLVEPIVVPGTFQANAVLCIAPEVETPRTVPIEISLNGLDWSTTTPPNLYTFYNLTVVSPSSGPAHGGTFITAKIDGGANFSHFKSTGLPRFTYRARFGDIPYDLLGAYNTTSDTILFSPRRDASGAIERVSATNTNGSVPFRLALTTALQFSDFPGVDFILYTASFRSVIPCMVGDCRDLAVPKNGVAYPVTFTGVDLVHVDTILCGYIPMNRTTVGVAQKFLTYTRGLLPPIVYPGMFAEDAVACRSPPVAAGSSLDGYHVVVALNGQNFDGLNFADESFNLFYIPQPSISSISVSGGLATGGALLTVAGSDWRFPTWYGSGAPNTLSCLFFLPGDNSFQFTTLENSTCTGSACTAVCRTPDFAEEAIVQEVLVRSQVFVSLNRRDPCMQCGCQAIGAGEVAGTTGFGRQECSFDSTHDRETQLSRFDTTSGGFCSNTELVLADVFFCKGSQGTSCPQRLGSSVSGDINVEFSCLGQAAFRAFTFYQAPVVERTLPATFGGESNHNKSSAQGIPIAFAGLNFRGSQWADWPWPNNGLGCRPTNARPCFITVRATFQDAQSASIVINAEFDATYRGAMRMRLPVPCLDQITIPGTEVTRPITATERAQCYAHTGIALNQTREAMKVYFDVSFNGGVQYTRSDAVLTIFREERCPDEESGGCNHGTCVSSLNNPNKCYCGWWVGNQTQDCLLEDGQFLETTQVFIQYDATLTAPKRQCKRHILWYNQAADDLLLQPPTQSLNVLYNNFGRTRDWPHHDPARSNGLELGCPSGPQLTAISPEVGAVFGGTNVTVTMKVQFELPPDLRQKWEDFTSRLGDRPIAIPTALQNFFTCFFGPSEMASRRAHARFVRQVDQSVIEYVCTAPPLYAPEDVNMTVSFVNPLGEASPWPFLGTFMFKFVPLPNVTNVRMLVGGVQYAVNQEYLSMPICVGTCETVLTYGIVLEGTNFLDTELLVCRVNGIETRAFFISENQVNCTLEVKDPQSPAALAAGVAYGAIIAPGVHVMEVSLNGQEGEWVESPPIDFYAQPATLKTATLGLGVDPARVGTTVATVIGTVPCVGSLCNTRVNDYSRLAPVTGNTPLVFYVQEPSTQESQVEKWSARNTTMLRFGVCQETCPPGTPDSQRFGPACSAAPTCSCNKGPMVDAAYNSKQDAGTQFQQYKLLARSPVGVPRTGRYRMCFSINSVHYMPMEYAGGQSYYFRFYQKPIVTKLSISDGPIKIPLQSYRIQILGSNFPVKTANISCDFVEVGLCEEYSPRIFVYFGFQNSRVAGYGSFANTTIPYNDPRVQVSAGAVTITMPDVSSISPDNFLANVTVSFNGYDFTAVTKGVTEFNFYRMPTVNRGLTPRWGHYDSSTLVQIFGQDFQNRPTAACRISSCTGACTVPGPVSQYVPARYVSPTEVTCSTLPRPPSINGEDTSGQMYVSYTPDGRPSTERDNPELFNVLLFPIGRFQLTNAIKFINISANAAPMEGGTPMQIVVIGHLTADGTCFDMQGITSLRIGLLPTSSLWRSFRPEGFPDFLTAPITGLRNLTDLTLAGTTAIRTCLQYINVTLPEVPYPLTADLKISLNNGQQFTGPTTTILFYRLSPPVSNVPNRGSIASAVRPRVSVFLDATVFEGANPELSLVQTLTAFAPTRNCVIRPIQDLTTICAIGPRCRFQIGGVRVDVPAVFEYDPFRSELQCTAPLFPIPGFAALLVTLDGPTFIGSPDVSFLYFDAPRVSFIAPTNGFWDARTNILVSGQGFLTNQVANSTVHLVWCIFDFRDIMPAADRWNVPRRWTKAYPIPGSNNTLVSCRAPAIAVNERPSLIFPRARVGVIIDGVCQDENAQGECVLLRNSDARLFSDAFFLWTGIPTITAANPIASLASGGRLLVTVTGTGFRDSYNVGQPSNWNQALLPSGFTTMQLQKLCRNSTVTAPSLCPGLSCRFGKSCPLAGGECVDRVVDAFLSNGQVVCTPPVFDSPNLTVVELAVSLNGMTNEFSNSLPFTYTTMRVDSLTPVRGTAFGGGLISVTGYQYVNVPCRPGSKRDCLSCRFTAGAQLQGAQWVVPATYVTSSLVLCEVPNSGVFGLQPFSITEPCGGLCDVVVSVSVNGIEYVPPTPNPDLKYSYLKTVDFYSFSPNSGPITGRTNVTVIGNGFTTTTAVQCRFGVNIVTAIYISATRVVCIAPPVNESTVGGVFLGFSTNSVDFCELVTRSTTTFADETTSTIVGCNFTRSDTPTERPYFYHDIMTALNITPPTGIIPGQTEVVIAGVGFTDYGQSLFARFNMVETEPCTIINSTHILCYSPPMPVDLLTPTGVRVYVENVAYPVTITSNRQQYTIEQVGQNCLPDPNLPNDNNPKAKCGEPFVMYSWHKLPTIASVSMANGVDLTGFNSNLNRNQFPTLVALGDLGISIPQGPTSGGTQVLIRGSDFTSFSRVELTNGPGVVCDTKPAPPGKSCTTTCTFPFRHSISGQQELYYSCINLRRLQDQATFDPSEYWCAVGGTAPATFAGEYGTCRSQISVWRDFRQGGKVVTALECLFGDTHVPATVIDNSTITCVAPPSKYGIVVPLSVTLNRRDYTVIRVSTRFQYIAPAPRAVRALPDDIVSKIRVSFDVPTNRAGLQNPDGILRVPDGSLSGCTSLFSEPFVDTLGVTAPKCTWLPADQAVQITLTNNPTFNIFDVVTFQRRACEADNTCWRFRTTSDLLRYPTVTPGCSYPTVSTLSNCQSVHSWQTSWCGRCVPDTDPEMPAKVEELSYPFNLSSTNLTISYPLNPLAPSPAIRAPAFVDTCAKACMAGPYMGRACSFDAQCPSGTCADSLVVLDATSSQGRLGRAFRKIEWMLNMSMMDGDTGVADQLATIQGLVAPVHSVNLLSPVGTDTSTYCFNLNLTNWLGLWTVTPECFPVTRISGVALPWVILDGPYTRTNTIAEGVSIKTTVTPSPCSPNETALAFLWGLAPMEDGWPSPRVVTSAQAMSIPQYVIDFKVGVDYKFQFNATLTYGARTQLVSIYVTQRFTSAPPIVALEGGSYREIGYAETLVLNASKTHDSDKPPGERSPNDLIYCWACTHHTPNGPPCNWTDPARYSAVTGMNLTAREISVPPGPLMPAGTDMHITLRVAKNANGNTCAAVANGTVPLVGNTSTLVKISNQARLPIGVIVSPDLPIIMNARTTRLSADIYSAACPATGRTVANCGVASYRWAVLQQIVPGKLSNDFGANIYGRFTVVLGRDALVEGQETYTFQLRVIDTSGATATARFDYAYNAAPSSGTFIVERYDAMLLPENERATGFALDTLWHFKTENWADVDIPLQYSFYYTATRYDSLQAAVNPADVTALVSKQGGISYTGELPQGNLADSNKMVVYARIHDALGAYTEASTFVTVRGRSEVSAGSTATLASYLRAKFEAEIARIESTGDAPSVMRYISIVSTVLLDWHFSEALYAADVGAIRSRCMASIRSIFGLARRRSVRELLNFADFASLSSLSQSTVAISSAPSSLATADARGIVALVAQAADSGTTLTGTGVNYDEVQEKATMDRLIFSLANCQNAMTDEPQAQWNALGGAIRALLVTYMKGKSGSTYRADRNGMVVTAKRLPSTVASAITSQLSLEDESVVASSSPANYVKFTNMILNGLPIDQEGADYQVTAYNPATNPFKSSGTQSVFSRVVTMVVRRALPFGDATLPSAVPDLSITNLPEAHRIELRLYATGNPPQNLNATTGVFQATVCSWWNQTQRFWNQFSTGYLLAPGTLPCFTSHLTDFGLTPGFVGCDKRASASPTVLNLCRVCGGGEPQKMQGICDWQAVPCYGTKDRCGVCEGQNRSFTNTLFRNVSGVCDYRGVPCQRVSDVQEEPTVCGICGHPDRLADTQPNAGICDCQGTGVPNGGKVLDRCKICDGRNATMDTCGRNGEIPVSLVCHTGGLDSTWNRSCTGCDGVPRPDLPWAQFAPNQTARVEGYGGVQLDACGVCGGNGSTCKGCDGVLGSGARFDVCGVCSGLSDTCVGCDDVPSPVPKQVDGCGLCGGGYFGACAPGLVPVPCDYKTLTPRDICRQGCDGVMDSGSQYDECGVCNGDGSTCRDIGSGGARGNGEVCGLTWHAVTSCGCGYKSDACGKCGGNGSTCMGCNGVPFSGKVFDACGICDGDNSTCLGCDGQVKSGKEFDLCGICDGGNAARDICGVCGGDGSSCTGCDGVIHSGKAIDACDVCGGTNQCKWRDGDPPIEAQGNTDAVVIQVLLQPGGRREGVEEEEPSFLHPSLAGGGVAGLAGGFALAAVIFVSYRRFGSEERDDEDEVDA